MRIFPDTSSANPLVEQLYGRGTDVVPATRNRSEQIDRRSDAQPASASEERAVIVNLTVLTLRMTGMVNSAENDQMPPGRRGSWMAQFQDLYYWAGTVACRRLYTRRR